MGTRLVLLWFFISSAGLSYRSLIISSLGRWDSFRCFGGREKRGEGGKSGKRKTRRRLSDGEGEIYREYVSTERTGGD